MDGGDFLIMLLGNGVNIITKKLIQVYGCVNDT